MIDGQTGGADWMMCRQCGSVDIQLTFVPGGALTKCCRCNWKVAFYQRGGRLIEHVYLKEKFMQTVALKSSMLDTASFDDQRDTILVRFRNGAEYEYQANKEADPPTDMRVLYLSFIHAESAGAFFSQHIKGKLPFRRIEKEAADASKL